MRYWIAILALVGMMGCRSEIINPTPRTGAARLIATATEQNDPSVANVHAKWRGKEIEFRAHAAKNYWNTHTYRIIIGPDQLCCEPYVVEDGVVKDWYSNVLDTIDVRGNDHDLRIRFDPKKLVCTVCSEPRVVKKGVDYEWQTYESGALVQESTGIIK